MRNGDAQARAEVGLKPADEIFAGVCQKKTVERVRREIIQTVRTMKVSDRVTDGFSVIDRWTVARAGDMQGFTAVEKNFGMQKFQPETPMRFTA